MAKAKKRLNQATDRDYESYWSGAIDGESIGAKAERKQIVAGIKARIEHETECAVCSELRLTIDEIERRGETVKHTQIVTSLDQQSEVYQRLKDDPEAVANWEKMMRTLLISDAGIAFIKEWKNEDS